MRKTLIQLGAPLLAFLLVAPASARSLKEELATTLFAASPEQSIFATIPNPALSNPRASGTFPPTLPLFSANPNPRFFGRPIQTGGPGGIAQIFTNGLSNEILTESTVVPLPSGSAGFEYTYNPSLNVFERTSIGLGAIYNERVNTLGKGAFAFGAAYINQHFDTFNGQDISNLTITKGLFANQQSVGEILDSGIVSARVKLSITTNTVALYGIYGVTEWLDASLLMPLTQLSLRAQSFIGQGSPTLLEDLPVFIPDSQCTTTRAVNGQCRISDFTILRQGTKVAFGGAPQSNLVDKTEFGVGDLLTRVKGRFLERDWGRLGGLAEFTFPTGSQDNFLGDGAFKARFLMLYSVRLFNERLNFHLNGGGGITTQTSSKDTLNYGSALDFLVTQRFSLIAELIGSYRVDSGGLPNNFIDGAFGFKVNPVGGLIASASFRIPFTDDGLRSDLVYLGGLEYDF